MNYFSPFASFDSFCQLNLFWHHGNCLDVDDAFIGVLEETNQISLTCLLYSSFNRALESWIGHEVLGDLFYQSLEKESSGEKLRESFDLP